MQMNMLVATRLSCSRLQYVHRPHAVLAHMQIGRRRRAHQEKHPDAKIISLGIGDTTEPVPKSIAEAMQRAAAGLGTLEGYSGWGTLPLHRGSVHTSPEGPACPHTCADGA